MKLGFRRGEKGFTLVELIVVIAIMGIIAAIVVPNVTKYVSEGKEESWNGDQSSLQTVVDAYYASVGSYPIFSGEDGSGQPTWNGTNGYYDSDEGAIDLDALVTSGDLHEVPDSASETNSTTGSGSYAWYLDSGTVHSVYRNDTTDETDFFSGVYP